MAKQTIETGTTFLERDAKINANFTEMYQKSASSGIEIEETHIFDTTSDRDTYFTNNASELIEGVLIAVKTDDIYTIQKWILNDPDRWEDVLSATLVDGLFYSTNDDESTEGHIVLKEGGSFVNSSIKEDEDEITFSKSAVFPPNTIYIGRNAKISNALRALNLYDPILERRGLLLAQTYDTSGSDDAFSYSIDATTTKVQNTESTETISEANFKKTPITDEIIESFHIYTNNISQEIDTEIVISFNDFEDDGDIVYSNKQTVTTDENGLAKIVLSNPIITDADLKLYVTMRITDMLGSTIEEEFVPKHNVIVQLLERKILATKEYVDEENIINQTYTDDKLIEAKSYTDDKLIEAKSYTDTAVNEIQPRLVLKRNSDQYFNQYESILAFEEVNTTLTSGFTNSSGEITASKAGVFSGDLNLYINEYGDPYIDFWIEIKKCGCTSWSLLDNSLKRIKKYQDSTETVPIDFGIELDAGDTFRIKMKVESENDSFKLETFTKYVTLGTVIQLPAILSLYKVGNI